MDINDLRSLLVVLAFVSFLGIVLWAFHHRSRKQFDEAAGLPFADDHLDRISACSGRRDLDEGSSQ